MDLSAILPLLLSKNRNGSDSDDILSMLTKNNGGSDDLFDALIKKSGASKEMASVLSSINRSNQKPPQRFAPILDFVSDDILGKLTRYFS